jgi:hypothetical protein
VEPIPETMEVIRHLTRYGDTEVATSLLRMSREVVAIAPECIGLSLTVMAEDMTFTMAATTEEIAELDSVQYLDGGPCLQATGRGETTAYDSPEALDEQGWQLFAQATARNGVRSTLSFPISRHGQVIAGVNLYGRSSGTFEGKHDALADVCGAWRAGAVTNADLSFSTMETASRAPEQQRERDDVDVAIGAIAQAHGITTTEAEARLEQAASRAGIPLGQVARAVIPLLMS